MKSQKKEDKQRSGDLYHSWETWDTTVSLIVTIRRFKIWDGHFDDDTLQTSQQTLARLSREYKDNNEIQNDTQNTK